jgi:hypothetical protein
LSDHAGFRHNFRIRFIGPYEEALTEKVQNSGLADVIVSEGPASYEVALKLIAESSVSVVIEAPCEEGIFFPSKVVDCIQAGRPILALSPKVGVLSDLFSNHGGGIAVDCSSPEAVSHAIELLFYAWRAGSLNRDFSSDRLKELFSPSTTMAAYQAIFRELELHVGAGKGKKQ